MANTLILKKSGVTGKAPLTSNLSLGEIAINYADGYLFYRTNDSPPSVQKINAGDADTVDGFHHDQSLLTTASPSFAGLTVDTNTLYVDAANNRVGINTTAPAKELDVQGTVRANSSSGQYQLRPSELITYGVDAILNAQSAGDDVILKTQGNPRLIATAEGDVGIGTTSPAAKFHVNGDVQIGSSSQANSYGALQVNQTSNVDEEGIAVLSASQGRSIRIWVDETNSYINSGNGGSGDLILNEGAGYVGIGTTAPGRPLNVESSATSIIADFKYTGAGYASIDISSTAGSARLSSVNNDLLLSPGGTERMRVLSGGNVGIGTSSPSYKLDVAGNAARIGNSSQTTTSLLLTATNTAGAPARAVQTVMAGYEGRGIGTFYTDTTYSGEEWFCGMNYSGNFDRWSVGYDASGGQPEYLANTLFSVNQSGNVGIGTYSPNTLLHLSSSGPAVLTIEADTDNATETDNAYINFIQDGGNLNGKVGLEGTAGVTFTDSLQNGAFLGGDAGVQLYVNGAAGLTLESGGDIGIGTNAPATRLDVYESTSTSSSSTGTSLLRLHNYVGSDLSQQKTFVDFTLTDDNGNETPQVRIGAEVGQNGDANSQAKEGCGAFVVYTNNADTDSGDAGASLAERMRVDYQGNVGIGTTSPAAKLDVAGNTDTDVLLGRARFGSYVTDYMYISHYDFGTSSNYALKQSPAGGTSLNAPTGQSVSLNINNSEKLVVNSAGNVGIGTTSPAAKLDVNGAITNSNGNVRIESVSGQEVEIASTRDIRLLIDSNNDDTTNRFEIQSNTSTSNDSNIVFVVEQDGKTGIGTASPQEKLDIASGSIRLDNSQRISWSTADANIGRVRIVGDESSDLLSFATDNLERLRINSAGNVGIGVTDPDSKLEVAGSVHVSASGTTRLDLDSNVKITGQYNVNGGTEYTYLNMYNGSNASINMGTKHSLGYISFESGNGAYTERMRITNTGNVGIGTTNPSKKLDVTGDIKASATVEASRVHISSDLRHQGDEDTKLNFDTDTINLITAGTTALTVDSSSDVTIANDLIVSGDLTVSGTTTTIDTATLAVEDHNIELGNVTTPSNSTANNGGITLLGGTDGDKTITWVGSSQAWTFNQNVSVGGRLYISTVDSNTSSTSALVLNGTEVEKRTLGSNAFNSTAYLPLSGGSLTGALDFNSITGRAITITGDSGLDSADASIYLGNSTSSYGWDLKYIGSGSGNNNRFDIVSTNAGSPVTALSILQDGNVGINDTTPSYKLEVIGGIRAGGKVTYTKSYSSGLDTTGQAVAGLNTGSNGESAMFEFTCFGGTGGYQKVVWSMYNVGGSWYSSKAIDEGSNHFDVTFGSNTFTFKARSSTQSYTPRVVVEASGDSIDNSYA